VICGVGAALPARQITNQELHEELGLEPAWIEARTGIRARYRVQGGVTTGDLATAAARQALASAGQPDVDLVIVATATPDHPVPATAPKVASRLGMHKAAAFDINAVCSGFVYALAQASAAITASHARTALVIGADAFSSLVDPSDAVNQAIFGDGAGAVVLRAGNQTDPGRIVSSRLRSDGNGEQNIWVPKPADFFQMDGREVFKEAVTKMTEVSKETAAAAGWNLAEIDWLVPHQANRRILNQVTVALGLNSSAAITHLDEVGNTSAASIPLALTRHHGRFAAGDRLLLTAFGGGFTWGAIALTWPEGLHVPAITHVTANEEN
jgi:3-oxoacyl-[acyl-carrier-protein] synthase-3